MAGRKYEQRLRAESADETRRRILDAVDQRLREAPTEPVSLDQVAALARVARSTIYLVFGSRAGMFDAFAEDLRVRTGVGALTEAVAAPDVREHLRGGIAAANKMYAADRDIYRVLFSMAQLDPDSVGGAVRKMDQERSGGMAHLARRLDAGRPAPAGRQRRRRHQRALDAVQLRELRPAPHRTKAVGQRHDRAARDHGRACPLPLSRPQGDRSRPDR